MKGAATGGAAGGDEDAGLQHATGAGRDAGPTGVTQRRAAGLEEEAVGSLTKHSTQHPARSQLRKRSVRKETFSVIFNTRKRKKKKKGRARFKGRKKGKKRGKKEGRELPRWSSG